MRTYLTQQLLSVAPESWQSLSYEYDREEAFIRVTTQPVGIYRVLALDSEDDITGAVALVHDGQAFYPKAKKD